MLLGQGGVRGLQTQPSSCGSQQLPSVAVGPKLAAQAAFRSRHLIKGEGEHALDGGGERVMLMCLLTSKHLSFLSQC